MNIVIQLFLYDWSACKSNFEFLRKQHRVNEYTQVFLKNLEDPNIKSIHVLCEDQIAEDYFKKVAEPYSSKAIFLVVGHQPTYREIMEYVKRTFPPNELICVMNGDIYFRSEKDHSLIKEYIKPNYLFALTRHEITNEGHTVCNLDTCPFTGGGSCDTFLFLTPLADSLEIETVGFRQNLFGAENVFMKMWHTAGYEIWNPCGDIVTLHLHEGRVHFEAYDKINTEENCVLNLRTPLPPREPSQTDT